MHPIWFLLTLSLPCQQIVHTAPKHWWHTDHMRHRQSCIASAVCLCYCSLTLIHVLCLYQKYQNVCCVKYCNCSDGSHPGELSCQSKHHCQCNLLKKSFTTFFKQQEERKYKDCFFCPAILNPFETDVFRPWARAIPPITLSTPSHPIKNNIKNHFFGKSWPNQQNTGWFI